MTGKPLCATAAVAGVERLTTRSGRELTTALAAACTASSSAPGQR